MKKALKIAGIALASLLGPVLLAAGIALALVTSSGQLTKMLRHYAPKVIHCETRLGSASLTLVNSFPYAGLSLENVALVNPMEGAPSDTLASIERLTLALDVKALLKEKRIHLKQCILEKAFVSIYTDAKGNSNLDIFDAPKEADNPPFDYLVDLPQIQLKKSTVFLTDKPGELYIKAKGVNLDLNGKYRGGDISTAIKMKVADFYLLNYAAPFALTNAELGFKGGVSQLEKLKGVLSFNQQQMQLSAVLPLDFNLKSLSGRYEKGEARWQDCKLGLDGGVNITKDGELVFDFDASSNQIPLESLLSYLPKELRSLLHFQNPEKDTAQLTLKNARVCVDSRKVPLIYIGIKADDLQTHVSGLQEPVLKTGFDVLLFNDISKKTDDRLEVNALKARIPRTTLDAGKLVFSRNTLGLGHLDVRLEKSDLSMQGRVTGLANWLQNRSHVMKGAIKLDSGQLDVQEIIALLNQLNVTDEKKTPKEEKPESGPFMVPSGLDVAVDLNARKTVYNDIDFNHLTGSVTLKDSTLVLQDIRCSSEAAQVQLSALYRSARKDRLFLALGGSISNVHIGTLLHVIPQFDTLVPMLKTFDGQCALNLDAETYMGADYMPKLETLHAAADLSGKDLSVNNRSAISAITDLLGISAAGEYRVDSLDVHLEAADGKIVLLPSQIAMEKYTAVVDGSMSPDKTLEYHLSLTESPLPLRHGLKIYGTLDDVKFEVEDSKYPNHYTPATRSERREFRKNLHRLIVEKIRRR